MSHRKNPIPTPVRGAPLGVIDIWDDPIQNAIRCKKRLNRIYLTSPSHN